ncbi:DUF4189 domain-containing protein [Luteibacter sp. dw_328]|jgi:hypothetical protein|uniref:DUF4189 domain-containing protein n=1 Tax=Luteibacter sp. dw_328 TaxID=2719796 RepID=UPI001BD5BD43|nr:DUF4189 domain-containing protein [Luteibacter sp. dw_328]
MKKNILFLLVLLMLSCMNVVHAEGGCPPGQYPQQGQGWQTCVPIPNSEAAPRGAQPVHVPSKWLDQWQAIATDTTKGIMGTSADKVSWETAEAAAISDCRSKGGDSCKVDISYANGCVAMVFGNAYKNAKGGPNETEAKKRAMAQCNTDDTNCHVYYSACSLPIEVPQ